MAEAIITLGRGIENDGTLTDDSASRVKKAVELYSEGIAPKIIMSGRYSMFLMTIPVKTEAQAMKELAVSLGCDQKDVIEEARSTHTVANAYFTKKLICEPNEWRNLAIVSSDEHMPRVRYLFTKIFGPEYNFDFVESERVISDEQYQKELEHEKSSMDLSRKLLDTIEDGDDKAIQALVASKRPEDTMAWPL